MRRSVLFVAVFLWQIQSLLALSYVLAVEFIMFLWKKTIFSFRLTIRVREVIRLLTKYY